MAAKTHKDRVSEFNAHLESLSEHHDIPKVSLFFAVGLVIYPYHVTPPHFRLDQGNVSTVVAFPGAIFFQSVVLANSAALSIILQSSQFRLPSFLFKLYQVLCLLLVSCRCNTYCCYQELIDRLIDCCCCNGAKPQIMEGLKVAPD